ncbi:MAG: hypothetical protein PHR39_07720, partial [Actinomycetota bacterium]|nr:hypothetical protein [Actinomycetota bacterium]
MSEEKKKEKLIEIKAMFRYMSSDVDKIAEGEAIITVNTEELIIVQQFKDPYVIKLIDVLEINPADYKLILFLSPNGRLIITELGYEFENFTRILKDARNEILAKYLLMDEKVIRKNIKSEYAVYETDGKVFDSGNCNVTIYETGISILPENGKLIRTAYCEIVDINEGDYKIVISNEEGRKIELSKMGYEYDSFKKALSDTLNTLDMFAQNLVMELDPCADTLTVRNVARLLRDGRAAMKKDIERYSSQVWKSLEKKIDKAGAAAEYNYLKSLSYDDKVAIGLKQGLMGELTSDYIWFLIPISSNNPKNPGNAIAMEAIPIENNKKKEAVKASSTVTQDMSKIAKDMQKNMAANLEVTKEMFKSIGESLQAAESETAKKKAKKGIDRNDNENNADNENNVDDENTGSKEESAGKATYLFKISDKVDHSDPKNTKNLGSE